MGGGASGRAMLLELERVSRSFGGVHAVDRCSLAVRQGDIHGLIGPNGAGKTTLLNLVSGLIQPTGGSIVLAGRGIDRLPPPRTAPPRGAGGGGGPGGALPPGRAGPLPDEPTAGMNPAEVSAVGRLIAEVAS